MSKRTNVKIELTAEQQAQIAHATGKKLRTLALAPEALEPRVAPGMTMGN